MNIIGSTILVICLQIILCAHAGIISPSGDKLLKYHRSSKQCTRGSDEMLGRIEGHRSVIYSRKEEEMMVGKRARPTTSTASISRSIGWISKIRGGITQAKSKTKLKTGKAKKKFRFPADRTTSDKIKDFYRATPFITRMQLSLTLLLTALSLLVIDPSFFLLDPISTVVKLQVWRPLTAAAFMGPPSMSWLSNMYFLYQYGTALENAEGTAQQLVFWIFNVLVLSILASFLGLPVTSNALITASLHVLGRQDPLRDVNWMFSIKIKYWMLPFCLALVDMLQAQNPMAALPSALGILSGHLYYFLKEIWPKMGGSEFLIAPEWVVKRLNRNNDAIIFQRDKRPAAAAAEGESDKDKNKKKGKVYKMRKD